MLPSGSIFRSAIFPLAHFFLVSAVFRIRIFALDRFFRSLIFASARFSARSFLLLSIFTQIFIYIYTNLYKIEVITSVSIKVNG